MSTPIPYLLFGKIPGHIQACTEISKPDFEVILHKSSIHDAIHVLPTLLSGGEIDGHTYPAIKLVVMGGGFSHSDFETVRDTVPRAGDVPWFRPEVTRPGGAGVGPGPPNAEVVAGRLRRGLDEHAGEIREGKGRGEVWWF